MALNDLGHVEMNKRLCITPTHLQNQVTIDRAIARGAFFCDTKDPVVRGNQRALLRGDEAPTNHPPRLGDFRGHGNIDVTLRGKQRHHRRALIAVSGHELKVVNRCARPLGHTGK